MKYEIWIVVNGDYVLFSLLIVLRGICLVRKSMWSVFFTSFLFDFLMVFFLFFVFLYTFLITIQVYYLINIDLNLYNRINKSSFYSFLFFTFLLILFVDCECVEQISFNMFHDTFQSKLKDFVSRAKFSIISNRSKELECSDHFARHRCKYEMIYIAYYTMKGNKQKQRIPCTVEIRLNTVLNFNAL